MTALQHVNILVDDLDAAIHFYADVVGLPQKPAPPLRFPTAFFSIGSSQELHINQAPDLRPERAHFCLRVDDFNAVFRRALSTGCIDVTTWGPMRRLPTGVMQLFIRDPSGNLVEVACDADQPVDAELFDLVLSEIGTFDTGNVGNHK